MLKVHLSPTVLSVLLTITVFIAYNGFFDFLVSIEPSVRIEISELFANVVCDERYVPLWSFGYKTSSRPIDFSESMGCHELYGFCDCNELQKPTTLIKSKKITEFFVHIKIYVLIEFDEHNDEPVQLWCIEISYFNVCHLLKEKLVCFTG